MTKIIVDNIEFDVELLDGGFRSGYPREKITLRRPQKKEDILFLKKWANVCKRDGASDYKKGIDFINTSELEDCYAEIHGAFTVTPKDRIPEQPVEIIFDYIERL